MENLDILSKMISSGSSNAHLVSTMYNHRHIRDDGMAQQQQQQQVGHDHLHHPPPPSPSPSTKDKRRGKFLNSAIDVIVVRQPDNTLVCSPFYIRMSKNSKKRKRPVTVRLNGQLVYRKNVHSGHEHGLRDGHDTMFRVVVNAGSRWCRFREEDRTITEQRMLEELEPTLGISHAREEPTAEEREQSIHVCRKKNKSIWQSKGVKLRQMRPPGAMLNLGARNVLDREYTAPGGRLDRLSHDMFMHRSESSASLAPKSDDDMRQYHPVSPMSVPVSPSVEISEPELYEDRKEKEEKLKEFRRGRNVFRSKLHRVSSEQFMESMEKEIDVPHDLLVPSPQQLRLLGLREGVNEMEFEMGDEYTRCYVYLWNWDDRIVVSDIDGTVTRHSSRDQILYKVFAAESSSLAQDGIVSLYSRIVQNGYKIVYLSARSIHSMKMTRRFLSTMEQDGMRIPRGPVVISFNSFWRSVFRDTVMKLTGEFKAPTLKTIHDLFPSSPFVAAFGDKISDHIAYTSVGIPPHRVFIVDSRSRLYHLAPHPRDDRVIGTYRDLARQCDQMFPLLLSE